MRGTGLGAVALQRRSPSLLKALCRICLWCGLAAPASGQGAPQLQDPCALISRADKSIEAIECVSTLAWSGEYACSYDPSAFGVCYDAGTGGRLLDAYAALTSARCSDLRWRNTCDVFDLYDVRMSCVWMDGRCRDASVDLNVSAADAAVFLVTAIVVGVAVVGCATACAICCCRMGDRTTLYTHSHQLPVLAKLPLLQHPTAPVMLPDAASGGVADIEALPPPPLHAGRSEGCAGGADEAHPLVKGVAPACSAESTAAPCATGVAQGWGYVPPPAVCGGSSARQGSVFEC